MQHLRWEKSGRTFVGDKPGQFVYKSSIGQQNVDLGDGQFAPYVWDKEKRIVHFADCELRFTASGLEFWHGEERLNTLSFNPEVKQGNNFIRKAPSLGSLAVEEIDPGNSKVELKISYKITTDDAETEISVRAGYNHKVHFGTRFKALKDGVEQRVAVEFAEKFEPVEQRDRQGKILPTARLKSEKSWWAWDMTEQADHEIKQTTITKIHLGRKIYALNEEKIISPDTWGTDVGIAANADDGYQDGFDAVWYVSGYSNFDFFGRADTWNAPYYHGGMRWTGITLSGTVITTIIDIYCYIIECEGTGVCNVQAWDKQNAEQFGTTNKPSNVTKTTAAIAWSLAAPASDGWKSKSGLQSIVQEILDSYGLNNEAINFILFGGVGSSGQNYIGYEDYNHASSNEPELTITYTPAGGLSIPVAMRTYRNLRN